nr:MAG TPA: hypothetical protein [Bacteriophage sp.]DAU52633.1 MAG TPA: hypothetical protein [Crassvirales sp.]
MLIQIQLRFRLLIDLQEQLMTSTSSQRTLILSGHQSSPQIRLLRQM